MTDVVTVEVIADNHSIPEYARKGDAGADLRSAEPVVIAPGARALVPTGVRIALPEGYVALVVPRSGLAARNGISIVNSPGTIDSGYRGEIQVLLLNTDTQESFHVAQGDRIAQLLIMPVSSAEFLPVEKLSNSERGEHGFGSTGVNS